MSPRPKRSPRPPTAIRGALGRRGEVLSERGGEGSRARCPGRKRERDTRRRARRMSQRDPGRLHTFVRLRGGPGGGGEVEG